MHVSVLLAFEFCIFLKDLDMKYGRGMKKISCPSN